MPSEDKRTAPRFILRLKGGDSGYQAEVSECGLVFCELQDISSGGLRGKLTDKNVQGMPIAQGHTVELRSFVSDKFEFIQGATGTVAWTNPSARQFGLRFNEALPEDEVEALIFHFTSIFT